MSQVLVHVIMGVQHKVMVVQQYKKIFQYVIEITMLQNKLVDQDQAYHRLEI